MKRRTKGLGSLVLLKNSPYYHARFYDAFGRKISMTTGTTIKQEAEAFLQKQISDMRRGLAPVADVRKITYSDLRRGVLASYVEKGNKSLRTRADGEETIIGLPQLDKFFGYNDKNPGPSVLQIGTDMARAFVAQRQKEGAGSAVINNSLAALRRMLKVAYEDGKIQAVPIIHLLKAPPARRGFLEVEDFNTLLGLLPTHLRPLICFLYYCGVRVGEAKQVTWPQVDLERRQIRLEDDQTKTGEARTVPLPSQLVAMLVELEPKIKTGPVFDATNLRKLWQTACAAAGLGRIIEVEGKKWDPRYEGLIVHDLRRSAVRNLVNAGVPERVAMAISGHKTRSVFDRYHVVNTDDVHGAMGRVELRNQNLLPQPIGYRTGKPRPKALKAKGSK
jgi:integrase